MTIKISVIKFSSSFFMHFKLFKFTIRFNLVRNSLTEANSNNLWCFYIFQSYHSRLIVIFSRLSTNICHNLTYCFLLNTTGSGPPSDRTIRETELQSVSTGLYAFMAVVAVLGILLGIFFLLINFLYRERRYSRTYTLLQQPSTVEQTAP